MNIKSLLIGSAAALAASTMAIASAHAADIVSYSADKCSFAQPDLVAAAPVDTTIIQPVTVSTQPKYGPQLAALPESGDIITSDDIGSTRLAEAGGRHGKTLIASADIPWPSLADPAPKI